ncbi:Pal1 cell morphology protein-domain-containing protein [Daedaleopsis nitida]|nr:Pal1 cell morphology protein-domain-containing protein [Daedaleopsis nitida]
MQVSKHQPRLRPAAVDPFADPSNISYSSYGVPTLTRNAPPHPSAIRHPPPPPPKVPAKPHSHRPYAPPAGNRQHIMDAVRDTVTVRNSSDQTARTRVARSQTELPPPSSARPAPPPVSRRSHSQDNGMEKSKSKSKKKGSSHADVIDRLDFSGVGPMFHHDGPFDACAPSRNRHRTKAPMMAWSGHEADERALANAQPIQPKSPALFVPYEAPKKKHDAIAEAWGIHEPEPFEDFSAGGGATSRPSGDYGRNNGTGSSRRTRDGRDARDVYREYLEENHPTPARRPTKRNIPPPQPIFVPEGDLDNNPPSPTSAGPETPSGNTPRRNKSIMQRIRKMRDSPNVPVGNYDDDGQRRDLSPNSYGENFGAPHDSSLQARSPSRPTHRSQGSFLGRFGRAANTAQPTTPSDDAFVYVDHVPTKKDKSLPTPPKDGTPSGEYADYFGGAEVGASATGLGRKTSLLKKVGTVVKGRAPK